MRELCRLRRCGMMKELYVKPIVEVDEFDKKDVITTSGEGVVANTTAPSGDAVWTDPI